MMTDLAFLIVVLIVAVFIMMFAAAIIMAGQQNRAKKRAQGLLPRSDMSPYELDQAKKILRTLSLCKDNEGRWLYEKLADRVYQQGKVIEVTKGLKVR